ncbi:hypothetical protein GCM10027275_24840 [Rhabdobacter roseus]|uniref:Uncharacterized protein n=1 Tax=Rhabdobacter roseus TaxID=1655419 RepID=A0A840TLZ5_9BACT|nr:hypothetical protein [Rhabdobacter roseus]MBB5284424.1 hypothetical protein [Rhabdobacter roseus]
MKMITYLFWDSFRNELLEVVELDAKLSMEALMAKSAELNQKYHLRPGRGLLIEKPLNHQQDA